ncbi:hypothetical protein LGT39_12690 [Demequina sp. TTPB684]|uniref:LppM family (lipo)protein n=1 Tax=unclassified Demequina TaxID=2620311 RepID=UPI001CF2E399|nr:MULTISPECIES: hypothetical protein [unclassified Demequina]MCB2413700.1 hypothetical protein [Demequina sp. TTPB684]UPU87762.1 hypothetical protein LGT36_010945 [Demequina sp. TMPB413]
MIRAVARAAVLLTVATVVTGCVTFESSNTFTEQGTVTQDLTLAMTPAAAEQIGIDLDTLTAEAFTGPDAADLGIDPEKVTVEDYVDGDRRGVHIVAENLTLEEFNEASQSGAGAVGQGFGTPMTVVREGDVYVVTVPADPSRDLADVRGAGSLGLIADSIDFAITFTFPGPVKSTTAGRAEGKTVVLGLEDLLTPEEIVIRGQATEAIAWGPILKWTGIGAVALIIVGGAAFLVWQDKRRTSRNTLPPPVAAPEDGGDAPSNNVDDSGEDDDGDGTRGNEGPTP